LAQKACRDGYSAFYTRTASLFRDLAIARADGSLRLLLAKLSRIDVLVIDDWAMAPLTETERRDFWEICEDRYPWKQPGTELEHEQGPDENQKQFLIDLGREVAGRAFNGTDPVMPILMTETSGHGTGKSVMGAWIADWILSTRPDSIGTVTAGTFTQLESRTWAAIQHWTKLCLTGHWFHIQARGVYHKLRPKTWKIVAQTCKEENAQAFAGQHARTSSSWYLFDEASLIPDKVWTVAQGGLTDGQPMFFAWGQCERNTGRFYEINFGNKEHRWNHRTVDSRQSRFTNKALIAQDLTEYGAESDYVRVRRRPWLPRQKYIQWVCTWRNFSSSGMRTTRTTLPTTV
jgi:hypothetical protein